MLQIIQLYVILLNSDFALSFRGQTKLYNGHVKYYTIFLYNTRIFMFGWGEKVVCYACWGNRFLLYIIAHFHVMPMLHWDVDYVYSYFLLNSSGVAILMTWTRQWMKSTSRLKTWNKFKKLCQRLWAQLLILMRYTVVFDNLFVPSEHFLTFSFH